MTGAESGTQPFAAHHGDGAAMWQLHDREADLVVTSPPYYPAEIEALLRTPVMRQQRVDEVDEAVTSLALSLAPVFHEIGRVLNGYGWLVLQTKDLRYGGFLVGPADTHRRLVEAAGFRLSAEVAWASTPANPLRDRALRSAWRRGYFSTTVVEKFLMFTRTDGSPATARGPLVVPEDYAEPLWRLPGQGARATHQHESPLSVVCRLVEIYSAPGDLVLDPMCGHGTILLAALKLGRRAVGYDIDAACVQVSLDKAAGAATIRWRHA